MSKYLILIALFFFPFITFSQDFKWAKSIGGKQADNGYSITVDEVGNIYTAGSFNGTADFDPGLDSFKLTSNGLLDGFISKLDANGKFIWAIKLGSTSFDECFSIVADKMGHIYITGLFHNTVDFDPGSGTFNQTSLGGNDVFILKLDTSGKFVWAKRIGGTADDTPNAIEIDTKGNIFNTGDFQNKVDFDPGTGSYNLSSVNGGRGYILKLDSLGNFIWVKNFVADLRSVKCDILGNAYITGIYMETADFDPGTGVFNITPVGDADSYILKLTASGDFGWVKSVGGKDADYANFLTLDLSRNVYVCGHFVGVSDFDPGSSTYNLTSNGMFDVFVIKLDSNGKFAWAINFGNDFPELGYYLTSDHLGNLYTAGSFGDTCDFDPGTAKNNMIAKGNEDIFISKFDGSGNYKWTKTIGGTGNEYCRSLIINTSGDIYAIGDFRDTADFDPGPGTYTMNTIYGNDIFILKLGECKASISIQPQNQSVNINSNTQFVVSSSISSAQYQWQQNSGSGFVNLSNTGQYSGVTNDTLIIQNVSLTQNNYKFRCVIKDGSCLDTSSTAMLAVKSNSINNTGIENDLLIYPNPANGQIHISSINKIEEIKITDPLGQLIYYSKPDESAVSVLIDKKGIYFITVKVDDRIATQKLIVD